MPERPNTPQVILRRIQGTQLQMFTTTGKHSYVLDEPETRGGTDLAATPFEFFIAGHAG